MRVTRRFWTVVGVGAVLVGGAVLFARPVLLGGAAVIGAWLLATQALFIGRLARLDDGLSIDQSVQPQRVPTDVNVQVTLSVTVDQESPLAFRVESNPPVTAVGSTQADRTLDITPRTREATANYLLQMPTAGAFTFDPATVTIGDSAGLFSETIDRGSTPTVEIQPRAPRHIHVGEGGQAVATAFGEHEVGRLGTGLEPAELREYQAGDAARRIDWKATARLGHPFVREFEAETDRTTALVVDHRTPLGHGPAGETKLDYLREVALAFIASTQELDDPLGLYTVGDDGLTGREQPEAGPQQYATIRTRLQTLRPITGERVPDGETATAADTTFRSPGDARRAADRLATQDDAFSTTLHPYFETTSPYIERIKGDPLFRAVEVTLTRIRGPVWTVILTDDTNPAECRETVKLARRGEDQVLVFLAPSVLFEPGGLGDLEQAYDRYREFEEFRRDLAQLERVSALEVGPGDRLEAVLSSHRNRRQERRTSYR